MNKSNKLSVIMFLTGTITGVVTALLFIYESLLMGLIAMGMSMSTWSFFVWKVSYPRCRGRTGNLVILWLFFLSSGEMTICAHDKSWLQFAFFTFMIPVSVIYLWCVPPVVDQEQERLIESESETV